MRNVKITLKFALMLIPLFLMAIWLAVLIASHSQASAQTLVIFCVIAALDGLYGLFLLRYFSGGIKRIIEVTKRLSTGDYSISVCEKRASGDELGELGSALNGVAAHLRAYVGYIDETVEVIQAMTGGKMWVDLKQDFDGEFEKLKLCLFKFSDTINATLSDILNTVKQVDSGAFTIASSSQTLAQGASVQASSIEELSAAISEVSERTRHNAQDAEKAKALSSAAEEIMQGSASDIELVKKAMEEISLTSKDISKVIKAIDDIAFQTNILALNASVEAARAGSAGKGFAVVADEVRNLSQKSAEAAKSTAALIERSIGAVNKGAGLVSGTGTSFAEVAQKSAEVSRIVESICVQAQEQAFSISQLSTGVEQISSVVQINSATAQENAAYSEELSAKSESLKNAVLRFDLF